MSFIKQLGDTIVKNSPTILTTIAASGVIGTTVMAVRATPKALQLIEEQQPETPIEFIKTTWQCYLPTAITGVLTITCIIAAHKINLQRQAALASVYTVTKTALDKYQRAVIETIGENKHKRIKEEITRSTISKEDPDDVVITYKGDTLCYDALGGRYFKSDIEAVKQSINKLNRDMLSAMFIPLNDMYYEIGLSGTKLGDLMGWHIDDGLIEPAFSSTLTAKGEPCLVLDFEIAPRYVDYS